jgi:hypothetical protein
MARKTDLERHIRESYELVREFEDILRTSDNPKEQARTRRAIKGQWDLIEGYLAEYIPLCENLNQVVPEEVREIAVTAGVLSPSAMPVQLSSEPVPTSAAGQKGPSPNAHALIIGIAAYTRLRSLSNTTTDAQELHDLLAQSGYLSPNLSLLLDEQATKPTISDKLDWLARRAGADDTVLIFFSGHGAQRIGGFEPGEYLCPVEADWYNLRATAISDEEFTTALRAIRAGRVAVFLDACHSGGVGEPKDAALQVKAGLSEAAYARLAQGRGRAVIASCRPDEVSWELPGMRNGLFTHYLLEGLRGRAADPDGTVGILDLFKYVSRHVPQHKPQHPLFKGEIELNFSITGRMKPTTPPVPPAPAPVEPVAPPKREIDPGNVNPTKLRQAMHSAYDRPAFEILCKDLGLDYHDLRGETLETKMLYLIDWHQRRRQYAQLVHKVLEDHPYLGKELQ